MDLFNLIYKCEVNLNFFNELKRRYNIFHLLSCNLYIFSLLIVVHYYLFDNKFEFVKLLKHINLMVISLHEINNFICLFFLVDFIVKKIIY